MKASVPRLTVFRDAATAARVLAERIADVLQAEPRTVFGLPTGRTPVPFYNELARLTAARHLDWSRAATFNLDEFVGVRSGDEGSYRRFMHDHLFRHVNLEARRIHFLNGSADPEAECRRYEEAIADAGGIDVQILGIGTNGHIGFNEPGPELHARTHRVRLTEETRRSNADLFGGDPARVPAEALSMGMATILQARSIVLLAHGESKASCIARLVQGPLTTQLPASFLQLHPDVELVLDQAAARELLPGGAAARP
jgi:glucosamine-6-phosphate deaminase